MRALENGLIIRVGLSNSIPLSVDTRKDLKNLTNKMYIK